MDSSRPAAHVRAYALWESTQGEHHAAAAAELAALLADADRQGWDDVSFVAAAGQAAYALVRPGAGVPDLDGLRARADGSPARAAIALALVALDAGTRGETEALLAAAGRAVALVDDAAGCDPLDRCTAYVVCAAAYNGLSLWELVDELYERAAQLGPRCLVPVQDAAVAVNRVLVRLEWAVSLLETGDERAGQDQLRRALAAVERADDVELPALWRRDVAACHTAVALLLGPVDDALLAEAGRQREALVAAGGLETVPLLDAARALALQALGRDAEARTVAATLEVVSATSGAASLPQWTRARVLDPDGWAGESGAYARLVAGQRWRSRRAVLVAARSFVALERLGADHERLTVDLYTDVLTGLANRRGFERWLDAPVRAGTSAAVLLLDLDGFKAVNDTHGHGVGDDVLRAVGAVIADHVRPGDLAARPGGDEFVVVLEQADAGSARRAGVLRDAVHGHDWSGLVPGLQVRVSIGVAVGALDGEGPASLYRRADSALYAAKEHPDGVVLHPGRRSRAV